MGTTVWNAYPIALKNKESEYACYTLNEPCKHATYNKPDPKEKDCMSPLTRNPQRIQVYRERPKTVGLQRVEGGMQIAQCYTSQTQ